jgi:predicted RNase H-like HicB family nuclease
MQYTYKIMLHKEPEGGYTVTVPVLPGCITYGENVEEAIEMAKDAINIYIEELQSRGELVPDDANTLEYSLNLVRA